MRVISTSGTRTIKVTPRYEQTDTTVNYVLSLYNESTAVSSDITLNYLLTDYISNIGQIVFTFTDTYNEGDEFSYKITDTTNSRLVCRGKIFATDQVTQNYSINE